VIDELAQKHGWSINEQSPGGCRLAIWQRHADPKEIGDFKARGITTVFETNDLHLHKGNGVWYNPEERAILEIADYVVVTCRYMQKLYARINPKCLIAHEALEDEFWTTPKMDLPETPLVLSWHGTASNLQYVDPIVGWIAEAGVPVSLRVVMPEFDHRKQSNRDHVARYPIPTVFVTWQQETWIREIATAHAGIVPLPDTEFCRAKAHHKMVGYQALGLPAIASDMPSYREVIRHGETGLLATTPEEWQEGVRMLADPQVRARMGEGARDFSKHFTREAVGAHWNAILEGVCSDANL